MNITIFGYCYHFGQCSSRSLGVPNLLGWVATLVEIQTSVGLRGYLSKEIVKTHFDPSLIDALEKSLFPHSKKADTCLEGRGPAPYLLLFLISTDLLGRWGCRESARLHRVSKTGRDDLHVG